MPPRTAFAGVCLSSICIWIVLVIGAPIFGQSQSSKRSGKASSQETKELTFPPPEASDSDASTARISSSEVTGKNVSKSPDSISNTTLLISLGVAVVGAIAVVSVLLMRRRSSPVATKPREQVTATALGSDASFQRLEERLNNEIRSYSERLGQIEASSRALATKAELGICETRAQAYCDEKFAEVGPWLLDRLKGIQEQLSEMKNQVSGLDARYTALQGSARQNLRDLLIELPMAAMSASASTGGVATLAETAAVVRKLEEAVGQYFKRSAPEPDPLNSYRQWAIQLADALDGFRRLAAEFDHSADASLLPLWQDLQRMSEEINALLADRSKNQVRLNLSFDYSTLASSRQTISQGIAAGLESEISKFANVEEFFKRRMANLGTRAAAEAADVADGQLDPERRNKMLQGALDAIFSAGEVEPIAPTLHEEYRATEHAVVQSSPGGSTGRPNTIAQLLTRGLRYQGRVVRKANVVLFN